MRSHIEVGRRYPEITINTTYSYGLDDQEFVVAFEGDDPGMFLDLVQELRPTESSAYTERETPIFTCVAMSVRKALDALDGSARRPPHRPRLPDAPPTGSAFPILARSQMATVGTRRDPLRVAIIGAGPSGFYAAEHILKDEATHAQVDLFDRLPTPFGLVRGGVAPDHPKIKSVIRVYEKTAAREGFRFFGNVKVGHDIEVDELERLYHAIVYTVGCETDRRLGIPGEDLPGSHAATAFVGWYNAHPDYADEEFDLTGERAVVIGNGNVAMDVARMLALTESRAARDRHRRPRDRGLAQSKIREIVVLGRRGPAQAAFTNPEIKELGRDARRRRDRRPRRRRARPRQRAPSSRPPDKTSRVNVEILRDFSQRAAGGQAASGSSCASSPRRSRSRATAGSRGSSSAATSWSTTTGRCARRTPASARRSSAAWSCARSATAASRSRASPSTTKRGRSSTRAGACSTPTTPATRSATTRPAGSSAGPPA